MLILKVAYDAKYYNYLIKKLYKVKKKVPIHVDVFLRKGIISVVSLDDSISASVLYAAYLKAKERGLKASLLYARYIDEDWFPEEVRKLSEMWLYERLSMEKIDKLKNYSVTEYMLVRWCQ